MIYHKNKPVHVKQEKYERIELHIEEYYAQERDEIIIDKTLRTLNYSPATPLSIEEYLTYQKYNLQEPIVEDIEWYN